MLLAVLHSRPLFQIEMAVSDYEMSQYGVVDNRQYASYSQHARYMRLCLVLCLLS